MFRPFRLLRAAAIIITVPFLLLTGAAFAASNCEPDGTQESGAIYRICMPDTWNGNLVVYAHGYVGYNEPVAIPEDQLTLPDGTSIPGVINAIGFAFATTSYRQNGLTVPEGIDDLTDLVAIFARTHGQPRRTYLVGVSEGGLITALSIERHPEVYDGGLAACGPIGNFRNQINYNGNFAVLQDYFFPGLIPGGPLQVPQEVIDDFYEVYVDRIVEAAHANPDATRQLFSTARLQSDPNDPSTIDETLTSLSWYRVFATNDAVAKLGGQPYMNERMMYRGSDDDTALNAAVPRYTADAAALATIQDQYMTTGRLVSPLVTIHTTGDQLIPYWHEGMYTFRTLLSGSASKHFNLKINRYGHCNFMASEVLAGFAILVLKVNGAQPTGVEAVLTDTGERQRFRTLVRQYDKRPARSGVRRSAAGE